MRSSKESGRRSFDAEHEVHVLHELLIQSKQATELERESPSKARLYRRHVKLFLGAFRRVDVQGKENNRETKFQVKLKKPNQSVPNYRRSRSRKDIEPVFYTHEYDVCLIGKGND